MVHTYTIQSEEERGLVTFSNIGRTGDYVKGKELDTERQVIPGLTHKWNIQKQTTYEPLLLGRRLREARESGG